MMEEEFDFNKPGKQTPYQVPSGFFDTITATTLEAAENRGKSIKRRIGLWQTMAVAASVAILLTAGYFLFTARTTEKVNLPEIAIKESPVTTEIRQPAAEPAQPVKAEAEKQKAHLSKVPDKRVKVQHTIIAEEPETLEAILATVSDEELLQLASLAESELYVYEQTLSNE